MTADTASQGQPSLRQLAIFDAVVRGRSTGRAAQLVGLSQPAVSHAIGQLERSFQTKLFERGRHGSSTTMTGAMLHRRVVRLREQVGSALATICDLSPDDDAVRQRLSALTSTQTTAHLAIASQGSFRGAAQLLGISEPAIQRTARELEHMVGVSLYMRRRQQISVTHLGEIFAASLQRGLAEIEQARDEIEASQGLSAGRITLACLPFMPKAVLATALGSLLGSYSTVQVSLEEGAYDRLRSDLKAGKLDMLLGALRSSDAVPELVSIPLFEDPYVIVARPDNALPRKVTPNILTKQGWVAPPLGTPRRTALEMFFDTLPVRPRIVLETASVAMTVETLMESNCLSLSCRSQISADSASAHLAIVDLPVSIEPRRVGVTLRSDWLPTPVQQAFLDLLTSGTSLPN